MSDEEFKEIIKASEKRSKDIDKEFSQEIKSLKEGM